MHGRWLDNNALWRGSSTGARDPWLERSLLGEGPEAGRRDASHRGQNKCAEVCALLLRVKALLKEVLPLGRELLELTLEDDDPLAELRLSALEMRQRLMWGLGQIEPLLDGLLRSGQGLCDLWHIGVLGLPHPVSELRQLVVIARRRALINCHVLVAGSATACWGEGALTRRPGCGPRTLAGTGRPRGGLH
eukprot:4763215-Alexandrium_andersonii.AAC.1